MKKQIARRTRLIREAFTSKGLARLTLPLRRRIGAASAAGPAGGPPFILPQTSRLEALEARLDHLQRGWDTHLPVLLDRVSIAISEGRNAESVHERLDSLRTDLDALATRLDLNLNELNVRLASAGLEKDDPAIVGGLPSAQASGGERSIVFSANAEGRHPGSLVATRLPGPGTDIVSPDGRLPPELAGAIRSIRIDTSFEFSGTSDDDLLLLRAWKASLMPGGTLVLDRPDPVRNRSDGEQSDDRFRALLRDAGFTSIRRTKTQTGLQTHISAKRPISTYADEA